jgi:uroporphyrinogen-III synthase
MAVKNPSQRVVLTRPADRQHALAAQLRRAGCEVLELPALTIAPISPSEASGQTEPSEQSESSKSSKSSVQSKQAYGHQSSSDAEVAKWQRVWHPRQFDVLVFVSRAAWQNYQRFYLDTAGVDFLRAARFGFKQRSLSAAASDRYGRQQLGSDIQLDIQFDTELNTKLDSQSKGSAASQPASPQTPVLACVGVSTARQIADDLDLPLSSITYPKDVLSADSEGLWRLLKPQLPPNAKILILRGQTGRDWLADTLTQHGAAVTCLSVYRREPAKWSEEQLATLKSWAYEAGGDNGLGNASVVSDASDASIASDAQKRDQGSTGTWLITSAEGLAAIEKQYQLHGLTGKPGFAPQKVVVVHERLKAPVCRWLDNWATSESNPNPRQPENRVPRSAASHGHTGGEPGEETRVLVVAPDDEAIAAGILRGE